MPQPGKFVLFVIVPVKTARMALPDDRNLLVRVISVTILSRLTV